MNLGDKAVVRPFIPFYRIEKHLTNPTLVLLDEARSCSNTRCFVSAFVKWLKTLRKYNRLRTARDAESFRYLQLAHSGRGVDAHEEFCCRTLKRQPLRAGFTIASD